LRSSQFAKLNLRAFRSPVRCGSASAKVMVTLRAKDSLQSSRTSTSRE
jgi:hypothetical protein